MLSSKHFRDSTGLDFPQIFQEVLSEGSLYSSSSPLNCLVRRSINFFIEFEIFRELRQTSDRQYENYSFLETVTSTSLHLFSEGPLPLLKNFKHSLLTSSKVLFNERFNSFSIIQINEFKFCPSKLRVFWQFEIVFSLLIHLCGVSSLCAAKAVFLYFEHFDLLFKFFEDVFLLLNFQKVKLFEIKKTEEPVKSRFGGFLKSVRSMLTQEVRVESENEIFIRQKLRGNITAKNKNSHLLRNFISSAASDFSSFKSLLDGLQFVFFGVAHHQMAEEVFLGLRPASSQFVTFLSLELFGNALWLKGKL